jgi:AcrR family transcriptional regulator
MSMDPLTTTRWGDRRRADSDFARGQILDAAQRCYQRNGVSKTTMEHIAREARVTRTTVYRYFQTRDEVLTGVILRATMIMACELHDRVATIQPFGEFIVAAVAGAYEMIPHTPVLRLVMSEETAILHRMYASSEEILTLAMEFLRERFEQAVAAGEVRADIDLRWLADWIIHIVSAYLLAPPKCSELDTDFRRMMQVFLAPALTPRSRTLQ